MNKLLLIGGAFFGLTAVILGAFAAHGLEQALKQDALSSFETGVRYQMYTALFMLVLGGLPIASDKARNICFYLTVAGILLVSGSIYFLATNALTSYDFTRIAFVTPIGGLLLIIAWSVVLVSVIRIKSK